MKMRKVILAMAVTGALAGYAEDSYLYWMIGDDGTDAAIEYNAVQVRAFETAATGDSSGSYLNLYYGNGAAVGDTLISKADATSGLALYAALAASSGPAFSYVVELFNDDVKVGQSESIFFTEAMAQNFVATVMSTGTFPALASWSAGGFSPVPEPTSGVLVLLGAAVLSLRRKSTGECVS